MGFLEIMSIIIALLLICVIALLFIVLTKRKDTLSNQDLEKIKNEISHSFSDLANLVSNNIKQSNENHLDKIQSNLNSLNQQMENLVKSNRDYQTSFNQLLIEQINHVNKIINDNNQRFVGEIKEKLNDFLNNIKEKLNQINSDVKENLNNIRTDNNEKLDRIQGIVDEKLQKTLQERLNNSFNNVIEQISGVNKAIGEIKGLASDVGSLKSVLTNVKTKGIVGEVILGNLIKEILIPTQYEENVITKKGSNDRVEFAIKMPGNDLDDFVYLPVDSKFPTEAYQRILSCIENGDKEGTDNARKALKNNIRTFAKDISSKYIDEPNTTSFAIMFLPIEGLYAEVINLGLFEELQREYKINIAGPSTFAALLNALQMGFKTLVIQKKSAELFKLLGAVKTEFNQFAKVLESTQKKFNSANDELDKLVGTRTRAIQRKLKNFEEVSAIESEEILNIE